MSEKSYQEKRASYPEHGLEITPRNLHRRMSAVGSNPMSDNADKGTKPEGNFFAIDSRLWKRVCALGLNEAVSYLVQARGTARDNRTTTWSVESIERYTGISRHRAAAALKALQVKGFVKLLRAGTKPKYDLIPFSELPEADQRPALDSYESWIFQRVQKAEKLTKPERSYAQRITKKGWLIEKDGGFTVAPPPQIEPDLIWLPNELITGIAHETPPLELVRQMQDVMTLRLLIDMYHAHNLREDGGVSRQCMWKKYHRVKINERAQFVIWGFSPAGEWVNWESGLTLPHRREKLTPEETAAGENHGTNFSRRSAQLHDVGLFEWVPHLIESDDPSGEIIHPVGNGRSDAIEDQLGQAALQPGALSSQTGSSNGPRTMAFSSSCRCRAISPMCR